MNDVTIFEVGPRDGLQNEKEVILIDDKVELINQLSASGLSKVEVASFVSPKWVPQMANGSDVIKRINKRNDVTYSALVPNVKGMENALQSGIKEIAVFAAASETFSQKNINCSIEESIDRFIPVIQLAKENNIAVRGYVSCITHCPYEGEIDSKATAVVSEKLFEMGCYEISLGDTIGKATAKDIERLLDNITAVLSIKDLALHCHDTYGQALPNILKGLEAGVRTFDSSVAGLGGCPYANGASGNVATEDLLYLLNGLGLKSGVSLEQIISTSWHIANKLGRKPSSKVALAMKGNAMKQGKD